MDITTEALALRRELADGDVHGVTRLAELVSRHANDRNLVFKAVLLKRELSRSQEPPSRDQLDQGLAILNALIADQVEAAAAARRHGPVWLKRR